MKVNESGYGNALVIYGGGLCALAAEGIENACKYLSKSQMFGKVYVGYYSFLSLAQKTLIKEWKASDCGKHHDGGYFGTCRNVDFASDEVKRELAIQNCKKLAIKWIFIIGGDGSSRQVAEISECFAQNGIHWCFLMPFTIDGINGGISLGIKPAVAVSLWAIKNTANTFLRTLESNQIGGAIYELQGRNRDDIMISVLRQLVNEKHIGDYPVKAIKIIAIPANLPWLPTSLESEIAQSAVTPEKSVVKGVRGTPTIILLSEGAHLKKEGLVKISSDLGLKFRTFTVGHLSQMNDLVTEEDRKEVKDYLKGSVSLACEMIKKDSNKSFTVVFKENGAGIEDIDYFAKLNPRKAQKQELSVADKALLEDYMP